LNELKDKKDWKWEEEYQKAFEEFKEKITSQLVLVLPRREGKFRVEMDASGYAIEGVLFQAIVEALAKWRQYLLDAAEIFEIWTDHKNLKYFWKPHKLNRRQARWYLKLQDYNFIL